MSRGGRAQPRTSRACDGVRDGAAHARQETGSRRRTARSARVPLLHPSSSSTPGTGACSLSRAAVWARRARRWLAVAERESRGTLLLGAPVSRCAWARLRAAPSGARAARPAQLAGPSRSRPRDGAADHRARRNWQWRQRKSPEGPRHDSGAPPLEGTADRDAAHGALLREHVGPHAHEPSASMPGQSACGSRLWG